MSELLLLQKEDVNLKSINKELAISKGLIIDDDYTNYFYVQSLYRKAFEKFLSLNINLNKYENQIIQSNLDFGILTKEKRNVFFKTSYLNLNYI